MKGAAMVAEDYPTAVSIDGGAKDVRLMLEATAEGPFEQALLVAVLAQRHAVGDAGHGHEDLAAVAHVHGAL